MKEKKLGKSKFRFIARIVLASLLVLTVGTNIALAHFSEVITNYFGKLDITSNEAIKARNNSTLLAEQISDEGIILLQNKDNTLPLKTSNTNKTKINMFGWSCTDPAYEGSGSGATNVDSATTPKAGLEAAGFEVNEKLYNDYLALKLTKPSVEMDGQDWTIPQPEPSKFYTSDRMKQATDFSDTAIVFISRLGGEGADLPTSMNGKDTFNPTGGQFGGPSGKSFGYKDDLDASKNYLEPSNREMGMIEAVTKNFNKVILVVNTCNTFQLDWVQKYSQIKSVVVIAGGGLKGFDSLGKVFSGAVNPSGRTTDIYPTDLLDAPSVKNFGNYDYVIKNSDGSYSQAIDSNKIPLSYVDYSEGIYVGYRYYETAAAEGAINYDEKVVYPFGYGLSYTKFKQEVVPDSLTWNDTDISVKVRVTNIGSVDGKDVVQLYYSAPYTGKLEKSSIVLGTFSKTDIIKAGESETVTLSFKVDDMASYDCNKAYSSKGAYVLEQGVYKLMLMNNSHEKIADVGSKTLQQSIFDTTARSTDKQIAVNQLDSSVTGIGSISTYLSRANKFENIKDINKNMSYDIKSEDGKSDTVKGKIVDQDFIKYINSKRYDVPADSHTSSPTTGAKNGMKLKDFVGVDYNDKSWDKLLDQMSVKDMVTLITHGGFQNQKINSIEKPSALDHDGPDGIESFISDSKLTGIAFPTETVIASTWNVELAEGMGKSVGDEAKVYDVSGWYAPAMNIHRSAFTGRNFEYYSEDGLLSGKMAAATIKGYQSTGGYSYMKHFALNDQETNRTFGVLTWSNEQAIREIYLKPFELAVKEGKSAAAMSSFNSIGNTWSGANSGLLNQILRNEWGFKGMVITDFYINGSGMNDYAYMNFELGIRNGNDLYLNGSAPLGVPEPNISSKDTLWSLRDAAHNILYTFVNSRAINSSMISDIPQWIINTIIVDIIVVLAIVIGFLLTFRKKKQIKDALANSVD